MVGVVKHICTTQGVSSAGREAYVSMSMQQLESLLPAKTKEVPSRTGVFRGWQENGMGNVTSGGLLCRILLPSNAQNPNMGAS